VRQNFWQDEHPGLGALLMAMGASSLVYVTLRPAIIAEGGSDLILLPSLFREAIARDWLGFAVVPGASTTPPEHIAGLGLQGVKTIWVLDADDGGRARRDYLVGVGVPEDRVVLLTDEGNLEIEDLVAPDVYVLAVQDYLKDVGATDEFDDSDLPDDTCRRHDAVEAWCDARQIRKPSKIAVANKVIGLATQVMLLDPARADELRRLHSRVAAVFVP
jgi:hypothetical protein